MRSAEKKARMKLNNSMLVALLMVIGMLVRLYGLGSFPDGVNQDEAYSAYEAVWIHGDTDIRSI